MTDNWRVMALNKVYRNQNSLCRPACRPACATPMQTTHDTPAEIGTHVSEN